MLVFIAHFFTLLPHTLAYVLIGGGIGGLALALACLHRGIRCTVYERDINFDERSQGYGE